MFAGRIHLHPPFVHFFQQYPDLHFGQPGANAAVDAVAEGQMTSCIFAIDNDLVCIGEDFFVPVGGNIPENDLVALFNLVTEKIVILQCSAAHMGERCLPADDFLHRIGDEIRILLQLCPLFGELAETISHARHCVAGGVVATDDQQYQIAHEFHRIHVAHMFGMDHHRDQVGRWFGIHPLVPEFGEIGTHFIEYLAALLDQILRAGQFDVACPVRPIGQQPAVFPRKSEQNREHAGGELDRDLVDPVKFLSPWQAVENFARALADFAVHSLHFGRRECRGDGAALAGMLGPVHGDEHRQLKIGIVKIGFGNGDAAMGNIGGINVRQCFDMLDRFVGGNVPEISVHAAFNLVDRCGRPHFRKRFAPQVLAVKFGAADIPGICFAVSGWRIAFVPFFQSLVGGR